MTKKYFLLSGPTLNNKIMLAAAGLMVLLFLSLPPLALAEESSADIYSRISQRQEQLAATRRQLDQLRQSISDKEQLLERNRMELADASTMLTDAEARYDDSLRRFNDRISAIYKMGTAEFLSVMLSGENLSDSMNRLTYLTTISESDLKLLQSVKRNEAEVRNLRDRVDNLKQSHADDLDLLKEQQQGIELELATGQKQIDADQDQLIKVRAKEQEEEAKRLAEEQAFDNQDFTIYGGVMGPSILTGLGPPPGLQPTGSVISGIASWYGPGFNGRRTSNGETYNMFAATAAHKTLPFGTWLKVVFKGRAVFVRINDRGPYIPGRFLDLSAGSAQALGLTGIGYVTAEIYR